MATDILNLQPNVISRDLKGKFICLYGPEKVGKSTFGASLPRSLFCNFEVGTNFLPGIRAVNIDKWSSFKMVLRQLEMPEAREKYDTVVIDTASQAYTLCEDFICSQAGVSKVGEIPYGAGYTSLKKEYESAFRKITLLGYGLLLITHSQTKNIQVDDETVIERISPALPPRAAEVVNRLVDIIAFIDVKWNSKGESERTLITRGSPTVMAGSRLPYLEATIPFGYQQLVDAVAEAIEKQEKFDGAVVVDTIEQQIDKPLVYEEVRQEAFALWTKLVGENEENAGRILKKVEMIFGRKIKLSEVTEDQVDLLALAIEDMKTL